MFCTRVLQTTLDASYLGGNHLSTDSLKNLSFSSFNSSEKVPLPLFGFLARGVYLVPPFSFLKRLRHCGTFIGIHTISLKDLGIFPAVSLVQAALAYEFTRHEHYEHLSSCEHGLSSTSKQMLLAAITRT